MSSAASPAPRAPRGELRGAVLPAFGITLLLFWDLLLVALLALPAGGSGLGAFAEDFRVWCFGYDPATGRLSAPLVLAMTTPPLLLAAAIAWLWQEPLRLLAGRRAT